MYSIAACPDNCYECSVADDGTTTECEATRCYSGYGRKSTDMKCHGRSNFGFNSIVFLIYVYLENRN